MICDPIDMDLEIDERVPGAGSLRLWLSDAQWMQLLARIEREAKDYEGPNRRSARKPRFHVKLRCVVRAQQPDGRSATYLVQSHNLSAGGMGFIHAAPLPRGSRCTVAIQSDSGEGVVVAGQVAWTRQVDPAVTHGFEVGVQFDRPIDPGPFITETLTPSA